MEISLEKYKGALFQKKQYSILLLTLLIVPLLLVVQNYWFDIKVFGLIFGIPIVLIFLFSYEITWWLFLIILFVNFNVLDFQLVVLFTIPLALTFFITHRHKEVIPFHNPVTLPLIIYFCAIIPSLINSINIFLSIYFMYNIVGFALLFYIIKEHINNYKEIKNALKIFLSLSLINGIIVIITSFLLHNRVFGFTGIVYVDYVCIAILISLFFAIYNKNTLRIIYFLLSIILLVSLIVTQTRNTLISLSATFIFLFFFIYKNSTALEIKKKYFLISTLISILTFAIIVYLTFTIFPLASARFDQLLGGEHLQIGSINDFGASSLVTRLLIWHTAVNAFLQHPIIGIGVFSFPYSSFLYFKIPPILFKSFVSGLSPHITFLASLTETGLIGFLGLVVFIISNLKLGFKAFHIANDKEARIISLILLSIQIYIVFSMFLTDAWLWGQCRMLWGVSLGLSLANYKISKRRQIAEINA